MRKKIKVSELPEEIQFLFDGEDEIEFESAIDPGFETPELFAISMEEYEKQKYGSAKKLVASRKFTEEMRILYEKHEEGILSDEKAEELMRNAYTRYQTNSI